MFSAKIDSICLDCGIGGLDHYGGDLSSERASSSQDCQKQCEMRDECKRWVFWAPYDIRRCYLKKEPLMSLLACDECASGFRNVTFNKCASTGDLSCNFY